MNGRIRFKVGDLVPLHAAAVSGDRPQIRALTDEELLAACDEPRRGDPIRVNLKTGRVVDGNGRVYELKRRVALNAGIITAMTEIACETYVPDDSIFPDLE